LTKVELFLTETKGLFNTTSSACCTADPWARSREGELLWLDSIENERLPRERRRSNCRAMREREVPLWSWTYAMVNFCSRAS